MAAFMEAMRGYAKNAKPSKTVKSSSIKTSGKKRTFSTSAGRRIISLSKKRQSQSPAGGDGAINFLSKISPGNKSIKRLKHSRSFSGGSGWRPQRSQTGMTTIKVKSENPQNTGVQMPIATVIYHNCSRAVRNMLDSQLQQLAHDPSARIAYGSEEEGNAERGFVKYFDGFCIDRFGIRDMMNDSVADASSVEAFSLPQYSGPINVVTLPLKTNYRTNQKDVKATLVACFNCGGVRHNARECPKVRDTKVIVENSRIFREFGNKGPQRFLQKRYQGRYYEESVLCKEVGLPIPKKKSPQKKNSSHRGSFRGRGRARGRGRGSSPRNSSSRNQSPHSRGNHAINQISSGIQVVENLSDFAVDARRGRGRGRGRGSGIRGRGSQFRRKR